MLWIAHPRLDALTKAEEEEVALIAGALPVRFHLPSSTIVPRARTTSRSGPCACSGRGLGAPPAEHGARSGRLLLQRASLPLPGSLKQHAAALVERIAAPYRAGDGRERSGVIQGASDRRARAHRSVRMNDATHELREFRYVHGFRRLAMGRDDTVHALEKVVREARGWPHGTGRGDPSGAQRSIEISAALCVTTTIQPRRNGSARHAAVGVVRRAHVMLHSDRPIVVRLLVLVNLRSAPSGYTAPAHKPTTFHFIAAASRGIWLGFVAATRGVRLPTLDVASTAAGRRLPSSAVCIQAPRPLASSW